MADRDGVARELEGGWFVLALGVRREKGNLIADGVLEQDNTAVFSDRVVLGTEDGRMAWADGAATGEGRPTVEAIDEALTALVPDAAALLQEQPGRRSQADRIVEIVVGGDGDDGGDVELFHTPDLTAYASLSVDGHRQTWPLRSASFRNHLRYRFYTETGKAPGTQALQDALGALEGHAQFEGPCRTIHTRVTGIGNQVYLDLADEQWRAVRLDETGFAVVDRPPVRFRRARGMLPLPKPARAGSLEELRPFLNLASDEDWRLVVAWTLAALMPRGPYPILVINGEQGSTKSTVTRVLKALVDPNTAPLRSEPTKVRDAMIAANNSWLLAFDNLSYIPPWLSDVLCRLATGGGFSARELYSDGEEVIFEAQRPVIINGIAELATRADLLDRAISLTLPALPESRRRTEDDFWGEFNQAGPRLLGALYEAASTVLKVLPSVHLDSYPRMADFARLGTATEIALGWPDGAFMDAYSSNLGGANELALEASPVGEAVRKMMDGRKKPWQGTASNLLEKLRTTLGRARCQRYERLKSWPKTATALSNALRRIVPNLRRAGIEVTFLPRTAKSRKIRLEWIDESSSSSSSSSRPPRGGDSGAPSEGDHDTQQGASDDSRDADDAKYSPSSGRMYITDKQGLAESIALLADETVIGLDLETSGLDPHRDQTRLVQLAGSAVTLVIDAFQVPRWAAEVGPLLKRKGLEVVIQNAVFDLQFLMAAGVKVGNVFDTMLAARVLDGGQNLRTKGYFKLALLAQRHLGLDLDKTAQKSDWTAEQLSEEQFDYAARDAEVLLPLREALLERLKDDGLSECARLEFGAVNFMAWLTFSGAPFDSRCWQELSDQAMAEKLSLEEEIVAVFEDKGEISKPLNLDSPVQVVRALNSLGVELDSTREEALQEVRDQHPVVGQILAYRAASKRANTYGIEFISKYLHLVTGRLHPSYYQIGTVTGRMSCSSPNLQNIPRDPRYRACFRPAEERVLVKADLGQVEICVAAELSEDRAMLAALEAGEDLHTLSAAALFDKPPEEVTSDERKFGKGVNFGTMYGQGRRGLMDKARSIGLDLTEEEAVEYQERFADAWPDLADWRREQMWDDGLELRTLSGRVRRLKEDARGTVRVNTPIQGTSADGFKSACALLWQTRKEVPSALPVLAVHDEVVMECNKEDAERVADWLQDCMLEGMERFLKKAPVRVDVSVGKSWVGEKNDG